MRDESRDRRFDQGHRVTRHGRAGTVLQGAGPWVAVRWDDDGDAWGEHHQDDLELLTEGRELALAAEAAALENYRRTHAAALPDPGRPHDRRCAKWATEAAECTCSKAEELAEEVTP